MALIKDSIPTATFFTNDKSAGWVYPQVGSAHGQTMHHLQQGTGD